MRYLIIFPIMKNDSQVLSNFWTENKSTIRLYLLLTGIAVLTIFSYLIFEGKLLFAAAFVGILISSWVVTQPKISLYLFLFVMFTNYLFLEQPVVMYVDLAALLVIVTAMFDLLLKGEPQLSIPKLGMNFLFIGTAFFIVFLFGYKPSLSIMPILHVLYIFITFLSLYRLSRYVHVETLLHLFYLFALLHAFIALLPFIGASKVERLFGFARSTLDDIMMIAFPIGLIYFIKSSSQKMYFYLISLLLIIGALMATQSRLSIMFAFVFGAIALYLAMEKHKKKSNKRIKWIVFSGVSFVVLLLIFAPIYMTALIDRFQSLLSSAPSETFLVRIVLWTNALTTFADNPIFGIGLGHYKILYTIYSSMHLHYMFPYIQNYSAHNMFFHYLAETGIVGTTAVFALIVNQFRYALKVYRKKKSDLSEVDICLFVVALLILVTSFIEAGWMWGQMSYIFIFFLVLNIRNYESVISNYVTARLSSNHRKDIQP